MCTGKRVRDILTQLVEEQHVVEVTAPVVQDGHRHVERKLGQIGFSVFTRFHFLKKFAQLHAGNFGRVRLRLAECGIEVVGVGLVVAAVVNAHGISVDQRLVVGVVVIEGHKIDLRGCS